MVPINNRNGRKYNRKESDSSEKNFYAPQDSLNDQGTSNKETLPIILDDQQLDSLCRLVFEKYNKTGRHEFDESTKVKLKLHLKEILILLNNPGRTSSVSLTQRESEIMIMISHGWTSREVYKALGMKRNTFKNHLKNIYPKMGVNNKVSAVRVFLGLSDKINSKSSGEKEKSSLSQVILSAINFLALSSCLI